MRRAPRPRVITLWAVKDYRPDGSDVSWRYFTESVGQVAEIWDPSGDISTSGWILQGFPP